MRQIRLPFDQVVALKERMLQSEDYREIIDNAPILASRKFSSRMPTSQQQVLQIEFLPKYSPELNPIEILWRFLNINGCLLKLII